MCMIYDRVEAFVFQETARQLDIDESRVVLETFIPNISAMQLGAVPILYSAPYINLFKRHQVQQAIEIFVEDLRGSNIPYILLEN